MKKIGSYLAIAGLASIILNFLDYNLRILVWIDSWGATTGWIIRIGILVAGLALFFLAPGEKESEEQVEESN